jgi:siroheme synthase
VVASASRPEEQVVETTLAGLPAVGKLPAPAILLIGAIPVRQDGPQRTLQNTGKKARGH